MTLEKLLSDRKDGPSTFEYPGDGSIVLQNILTAQQLTNPEDTSLIRRAIKRGFATNTTVGTVSRYMSLSCNHYLTGKTGLYRVVNHSS